MIDDRLLRVGITQGDTNGIGAEIILKMLADERLLELCTPVVFGSMKALIFYRDRMDAEACKLTKVAKADAEIAAGAVAVVDACDQKLEIVPGQATEASGKAAFDSLKAAVEALKAGEIDVLLTAPIDKHAIHSEEFNFPGHTEFLQEADGADGSLMILFSDRIRVALVTTHTPVSRIAEALTTELIVEKLRMFNASLKRDFGIVKPRIAVLALNPHAGDGGLMGTEEQAIIAPAIATAQAEKISCFGPYSADGFFGAGQWQHFDGVLAMYHDQGLAPFKALAMDAGVNFTAGLSFVRTSPDHGTGADIAGQGVASEESLRRALYAAIDIFRNRERYDEATANPLRKHYHDRAKGDPTVE